MVCLVICMALALTANAMGGDMREGQVGVEIYVAGWAEVRIYGETMILDIVDPSRPAESEKVKWAVHANTPVTITFASQGFESDIDYTYPGDEWGTVEVWEFYQDFHPMNYFTYKVYGPGDNTTVYTFKPHSPDWNPDNIVSWLERNTEWSDTLYGSKSGDIWIAYDLHPNPGKSGWMPEGWAGWEGLRADRYHDTILITVAER
jgi:hypothetical protein